jgi:hypothetical protein
MEGPDTSQFVIGNHLEGNSTTQYKSTQKGTKWQTIIRTAKRTTTTDIS